MSKALRKAIMRRSALENKYLKNKKAETKRLYKKQKNYCSKLYKKERKQYFANLSLKNVTDNKKFWQTVKPFFSEKGSLSQRINIIKDNSIVSEDTEVAEILNDFFKNAVSTLEINENRFLLHGNDNLENPIERAISKFSLHPSILEIKNRTQSISGFSFCEVTLEDMRS